VEKAMKKGNNNPPKKPPRGFTSIWGGFFSPTLHKKGGKE
jgi:hypothetical protein